MCNGCVFRCHTPLVLCSVINLYLCVTWLYIYVINCLSCVSGVYPYVMNRQLCVTIVCTYVVHLYLCVISACLNIVHLLCVSGCYYVTSQQYPWVCCHWRKQLTSCDEQAYCSMCHCTVVLLSSPLNWESIWGIPKKTLLWGIPIAYS